MKRFTKMIAYAITLTFSLTVVLSGCGSTPAASTTTSASTSTAAVTSVATETTAAVAKKTVTVWAVDGDYVRRADEKCNALIKDEIDVQMNYIPNTQYESKLKVAMSSGDLPDVIGVDSPNLSAYAESGAIVPLDDVWDAADREDLIDAVKQGWTYKGQVWGAQHEETNCVLYYNKDMLEKAGLKPAETLETAWTWQQTIDAAKKLTQKDANGKTTVYGILPLMAGPNIAHEGQNYVSNTWTWQAGAEIMDPEGTTVDGYFNSDKNLNALKLFQQLFVIDKSAPLTEIPNGFQTGKIAMWVTGPWMISTLKTIPELKWGAMPLPKGERMASNDGGWGYSVTKKATDKAAAMKVILAKTGKEGQLIDIIEGGALPNRKSLFDKAPFLKEYPYPMMLEQLEKTAKARPTTAAYPTLAIAMQKCFNDVAYGKDPAVAMKEYSAQMNAALKKANAN
ncbi:MAG TPA: extracellular solute-binding protein [Ruminiclostridium sp.]